MRLTVKSDEPGVEKKVSLFFQTILDREAVEQAKKVTHEVEELYNEEFKKDFETATIINDSPKAGELNFKKTKVDVKLNAQVYNKEGSVTIVAKTEKDYLTLRSQDIGTGDQINYQVLEKFGIKTEGVKPSELDRWYMNPKYHLKNFKESMGKLRG